MSRSNRKVLARERRRRTGEPYELLHQESMPFGTGTPLLPNAVLPAQIRFECRFLSGLLHHAPGLWLPGARLAHPLFVSSVHPSEKDLRLVVADVSALGVVLAADQAATDRPAEAWSIRRGPAGTAHLTSSDSAPAAIALQCSHSRLTAAVTAAPHPPHQSGDAPYPSARPTGIPLIFQAALSGLLRRIILFDEQPALSWLIAWYGWLVRGRTGPAPQIPGSLASDLTHKDFALEQEQLHALGVPGATPGGVDGQTPLSSGAMGHMAAPHGPEPTPADRHRRLEVRKSGRPYDELAVTAMGLAPGALQDEAFFAMHLPDRWAQALLQLSNATRATSRPGRMPISVLDEAISAVFPSCSAKGLRNEDSADEPWLVANWPYDTTAIFRLACAWVRAQHADPKVIDSTLSQLSVEDLSWSELRTDVELPLAVLARLAPMAVAAKLSRAPARLASREIRFAPCRAAKGTELISWPPEQTVYGARFSVSIAINILTVPFTRELRVGFSFGVRRWLSAPARLRAGEKYTAYFAVPAPGATTAEQRPPAFGQGQITLERSSDARGTAAWAPQWSPDMAAVLDGAGLNQLPDPVRLVEAPTDQLESDAPYMLVRPPGMPGSWQVSNGLPVRDRAALMDWMIDELAPSLQPLAPLKRSAGTVLRGVAAASRDTIAPDDLRDTVGPSLSIELSSQSDASAQLALDRLQDLLGVTLPQAKDLGQDEVFLDNGPMTLGVRRIPSMPNRSSPRDWERFAHGLPVANRPTITLIEVADAEPPGVHVPLAVAGRISQTVRLAAPRRGRNQPGKDGSDPDADRIRIARAVDGLFRQIGVRPSPLPAPRAGTLGCRPAYLAFWLARPGRSTRGAAVGLPVAVLIDPTGRRTHIRTPSTPWQPLHAGLIDMARHQERPNHITRPDTTRSFIQAAVADAAAQYPDVLMLTHAQNMRSAWPFLQNRNILPDALGLGANPLLSVPMPAGMRHLRVRTADHGEAPQCFGVDGTAIGHSKGLWHYSGDRVFGSTGGKPATAADALLGTSKLQTATLAGTFVHLNPTARVWNESIMELLVAGLQDGDYPAHWAALAHDLRGAVPYTNWTVDLPWPLHLARQAARHVPPAEPTRPPPFLAELDSQAADDRTDGH
ncbi:hypothetical protein ABH935_005745 [Catenulispora sp. GAS73]|uniref:pPIWI_RE module domain-containing protein n=1 Tax=Catenulispora sp. GAS73 TaxID=3156269 RepID=UPI003511BAAE